MITRYFFSVLLSLTCLQGFSQLCQGSLGDPIVNITFGSGNNPGSPLAAAATGYQFVSSDCPNDGFYTVRSNSTSCFNSSWHNLASDHTGNGNGYFMLVNASIQPSAFYVETVRGLCGNSTYEFAAWIMNVLLPSACNSNGNQPNLTFTIEKTDGTVLKSYNSGNIPSTSSPTWKQYGFFFTTPPAGSDIVLRIVNNAPGGCGNDLALDDITFRPCGPQVSPSITGEQTNTANLCEGSSKTFNLSTSISAGFNNPEVQWQHRFNNGSWSDLPGENNFSLTADFTPSSTTGSYEYRLVVAEAGNLASLQCRITSLPVKIIVHPNPVVATTNNGPVCEGSSINIAASGGSQYVWSGPNNYSSNASTFTLSNIKTTEAGTYNVAVTSDASCTSTGSTTITVNPAPVAAVTFADTTICTTNSVELTASGGTGYQWLPLTGLAANNIPNPVASPVTGTRYKVIVSNVQGCTDSTFVQVNVNQKAIAKAGPDKTIILGGTATLSGSIEGTYDSFNWTPVTDLNDPFILQPAATPTADAQFVLTAISTNDCGISTDTVMVKLYRDIYIPNAFSPNNDGLNDTWNIPALEAYPGFELLVFNRYGEVVFENRGTVRPWDGRYKSTDLPMGAYVYIIRLDDTIGTIKGTVMIVR
jgi:gliding motility-associated-like protein